MQSIEEMGEERLKPLDGSQIKHRTPNACMEGFSVGSEVRKLMQVMEEKPNEGKQQ